MPASASSRSCCAPASLEAAGSPSRSRSWGRRRRAHEGDAPAPARAGAADPRDRGLRTQRTRNAAPPTHRVRIRPRLGVPCEPSAPLGGTIRRHARSGWKHVTITDEPLRPVVTVWLISSSAAFAGVSDLEEDQLRVKRGSESSPRDVPENLHRSTIGAEGTRTPDPTLPAR